MTAADLITTVIKGGNNIYAHLLGFIPVAGDYQSLSLMTSITAPTRTPIAERTAAIFLGSIVLNSSFQ